MADFQAHVPQAIEDGFGDLLAPGGLFVRQDKKKIDVGFRRHQPAAIATGGNHGHPFGPGGNWRMVQMARRGLEQNPDDLVLDETQPLRATPPVPVLQEHGLRGRACFDQLGLQQLCYRSAENVLPSGMLARKRIDRRGDPQRNRNARRPRGGPP